MQLGTLIITKAASTAFILFFFLCIVGLLRYLYGPKGILRDPKWDEWNEEARRNAAEKDCRCCSTSPICSGEARRNALEEKNTPDGGLSSAATPAASHFSIDVSPLQAFAAPYYSGEEDVDKQLRLKEDHSLRVLAHAENLIQAEKELQPPDISRALRLAALWHDAGRFPQFAEWRTFADPLSCNHGLLGSVMLGRHKPFANESAAVRRLARTAVVLHNRMRVPENLPPDCATVLHAVRDADKLDILRILAENLGPGRVPDPAIVLHLEDAPGKVTPVVTDMFEQRLSAAYADMRFHNDMRILTAGWLFSFRFAAAKTAALREGHIRSLLLGITGLPELQHRLLSQIDKEAV